MATQDVRNPFPFFTDQDGKPLHDGSLYIGLPNLDPVSNPAQVYWDSSLSIPASQPIKVSDGYPYRSGTPAAVYVNGAYSILVRDKHGDNVYSCLYDTSFALAGLASSDVSSGDALITVKQSAYASAVAMTQHQLNGIRRSIWDWLSDAERTEVQSGSPTTSLSSKINTAILEVSNGGGGEIYFPKGIYLVNPATPVILKDNVTLVGEGDASVIKVIDNAGDYTTVFSQASNIVTVSSVGIRDLCIDQNTQNNPICNITPGDISKVQFVISLTNFSGVRINNVTFKNVCGVNTVSCNGVTADGVDISECRVVFIAGTSSRPGGFYDNSAIYTNASNCSIYGNTFTSISGYGFAVTAVEVHTGYNVNVFGNMTYKYAVGCNVVGHASSVNVRPSNNMTVTSNSFAYCAIGVAIWSLTSAATRNITVESNTIHVANDLYTSFTSFVGVGLHNGTDASGDFENISITSNTIMMTKENRSGYNGSESAGLFLVTRGNINGFTVSSNVVRNAPSQGCRVESKTGTVTGLVFVDNVLIDSGNNTLATPYRIAAIFAGKIIASVSRGNMCIDTGATLYGVTSWFISLSAASYLEWRDNEVHQVDTTTDLSFVSSVYAYDNRNVPVTYAASMFIRSWKADVFTITATNGTAFSINAPANDQIPGKRITIWIKNASGGTLGTVTWSAAYKLAGAWTQPANGFGRNVVLESDGTSWYEISRSAADVAN
jgi:hypothetical protein